MLQMIGIWQKEYDVQQDQEQVNVEENKPPRWSASFYWRAPLPVAGQP